MINALDIKDSNPVRGKSLLARTLTLIAQYWLLPETGLKVCHSLHNRSNEYVFSLNILHMMNINSELILLNYTHLSIRKRKQKIRYLTNETGHTIIKRGIVRSTSYMCFNNRNCSTFYRK